MLLIPADGYTFQSVKKYSVNKINDLKSNNPTLLMCGVVFTYCLNYFKAAFLSPLSVAQMEPEINTEE